MKKRSHLKTHPSSTPFVSTKGRSLQCQCHKCQHKKSLPQQQSAHQTNSDEIPPIVHEVLQSPGQPLDQSRRVLMESRLGQNFSQVRVHQDQKAAESARAINALAYTVGDTIVFAAGQYAPKTEQTNRLLAHELTHIIQQRQQLVGAASSLNRGTSGDRLEQEANSVAGQVVTGRSSSVQQQISPMLQRQPDNKEPFRKQQGCPEGFTTIERATWFHCGESGAKKLACATCSPEGKRNCNCTQLTETLGHSNIIAPLRIGRCGDIFELTTPDRVDSPVKVTLAERPGGVPLDIHRDVIPQLGLTEKQGRYTVCLKRTAEHDNRVILCGSSSCKSSSNKSNKSEEIGSNS